MTKRRGTVNIGDTDENADWVKTPDNRKTEAEIHDELEKRHEADEAEE